jgi:hypothetical protein
MTEDWAKPGAAEQSRTAEAWPGRHRLTFGSLAVLCAAVVFAIWLLLGAPA